MNGPVISSNPESSCFKKTTRFPRNRPARRMRTVPGVIVARSLALGRVFSGFLEGTARTLLPASFGASAVVTGFLPANLNARRDCSLGLVDVRAIYDDIITIVSQYIQSSNRASRANDDPSDQSFRKMGSPTTLLHPRWLKHLSPMRMYPVNGVVEAGGLAGVEWSQFNSRQYNKFLIR